MNTALDTRTATAEQHAAAKAKIAEMRESGEIKVRLTRQIVIGGVWYWTTNGEPAR